MTLRDAEGRVWTDIVECDERHGTIERYLHDEHGNRLKDETGRCVTLHTRRKRPWVIFNAQQEAAHLAELAVMRQMEFGTPAPMNGQANGIHSEEPSAIVADETPRKRGRK